MKIYTKNGDDGYSDMLNKRIKKSDNIYWLVGTIDKINGILSLAAISSNNTDIQAEVNKIQKNLTALNGNISGYGSSFWDESFFEERIDFYSDKIGGFDGFFYPKSIASAYFDIARCVTRDAERIAVSIDYINPQVKKYLNRMSDYLYIIEKFLDY